MYTMYYVMAEVQNLLVYAICVYSFIHVYEIKSLLQCITIAYTVAPLKGGALERITL